MKLLMLLSAFIVLSTIVVKGQTFAMLPQSTFQSPVVYSPASFTAFHYHRKICGVAKAGGITASAGFVFAVSGLGYFLVQNLSDGNYDDHDLNTSIRLAQIGAGLAIIGFGLGLAGVIHDVHEKGWGVVMPKSNQLGIAYNF